MKIKSKGFKKNIRFVFIFLFILLTLVGWQYIQSKCYNFPAPVPFAGNKIYNPYENKLPDWQKANFHGHSIAWGGITNGHQSSDTVINYYKNKLGYTVPCISNYHSIATTNNNTAGYIPVYEHGYNVNKVHQLAIGGAAVCNYDISLFQSLDNEQYIINQLKEKAPLVALAHPSLCGGYSEHNLKRLTGYDLFEVINFHRNSEKLWDIALSAGKPVWIIADDDCHDISLINETGRCWTMINSSSNKADDIYTALKKGSCYGVEGFNAKNTHYLQSVQVKGDTCIFTADSTALEIKLIGNNGATKAAFTNVNHAQYVFNSTDTYIRAIIKFKDITIYLNPLLRYDGTEIPVNTNLAATDFNKTMFIQLVIFLPWLFLLSLFFKPVYLRRSLFISKYKLKLLLRRKKEAEWPVPVGN